MKTINQIILASALFFISIGIKAQQSPMYTHYMFNTLSVNPAYAGSRDALTITALHRSQWVDFKGAPMTQTITVHSPIGNKHIGLGLTFVRDKIGPVTNTSLSVDFAYIMQISKKTKLALGLKGGANIFKARLSSLNLDENLDPVFINNINNKITPNFGFGIYLHKERFYVGLSAPNFLQNKYSLITDSRGVQLIGKENRHYFLIAGASFKLSNSLDLRPTTLIKVTANAPIQADLTATFVIKKMLHLGMMYRVSDAFGVLVGVDIAKKFHIGYSFDWSYALKTSVYNKGSHEIVLRYDFIYGSKKQIQSPRYF